MKVETTLSFVWQRAVILVIIYEETFETMLLFLSVMS
jgi:hypothetical protein